MQTKIVSMLWVAFLSLPVIALAQQKISGTVTDLDGNPLVGATVQIKNSLTGVSANESGYYELEAKKGKYTLVSTFLGFQKLEREISVQDGDVEINFVLQPKSFVGDEVVIQATRLSQSAPVSQVTRSKEEIEKIYRGQDGGFLLEELSPSIVTYTESGTNFSNYAGIRLRGIDQTRINMTLNGVPLNDMIDQGVFFSNFTDFGNSIQSVQIQRGVGTSSNGTSSYAGSINFESVNLLDTTPSFNLQLTGGSFFTRRASAEVSTGKMANNFSFYARYTETHADGYRYNTSTNSRSFFISGAYFHKKHTIKFTGFNGRSRNGLAYLPVALSDIENDPRTNYVSENDIDNFGQWMTQLQHIYEVNQQSSLINTVYYNGAGGDFPFGFEDEVGNFTQINYPLYNDHVGAMSVFNTNLFKNKLQVNTGVHGSAFFRRNVEQIIPDFINPYYDDRSRKYEFSAFGKGIYKLKRFEFFGDIQLRSVWLDLEPDNDFLSTPAEIPVRNWIFVNPRVGVTYNVNTQWQLYTSFGRTGREPTRFDILGSTQINDANIEIAQDENQVVPEFVNNLEAGLRFSSSKLQFQANLFYMQFQNEIAPIGEFIPEGFVQVYRNQEASYRVGVELDYNWSLHEKIRLLGNATYMKANISSYTPEGSQERFENITPILSPEWNIQTTLEVDFAKNVTAGIRTRFLSESFMELTNDSELVVPSSFITDFRFSYNFFKEHVVSFQFNNIFNTLYYTYGAPVFLESGAIEPGYFVQPPRHFYLTLNLNF